MVRSEGARKRRDGGGSGDFVGGPRGRAVRPPAAGEQQEKNAAEAR